MPTAADHTLAAKENAAAVVSQTKQQAEDDSSHTASAAEQAASMQLASAAKGHVKQSTKHTALPHGKAAAGTADVLSPSSYLVKEYR